jgi:hypothetical protein
MKRIALGTLFFGLALVACGGDGGAPLAEGPRTLAYALTECRDGKDGAVGQQVLRIRHGDREVTVMEFGPFSGPTSYGLCRGFGLARYGPASVQVWAIQRLGVSPDGSTVVFEVTDDFSLLSRSQVPPEQEGFYVVGADGSGLRRIAAASRAQSFLALGVSAEVYPYLGFNPDRPTVVFPDLDLQAPAAAAPQIVTLDLASGQRHQLTHLPPSTYVNYPIFSDSSIISFLSSANPDGTNPQHETVPFTVTTDPDDPQLKPLPVIALPGGEIIPDFRITAAEQLARGVTLPGRTPVNGGTVVSEAFVFSSTPSEVLQLTNFGRWDTSHARLTIDRRRVVFLASADPVGENPGNNCELFSIDRIGGDLRQLTHIGAGPHSNCNTWDAHGRGCSIVVLRIDPVTGWVTFYSSCDPFGTNATGGQIFTIRPDGSGLRQLTTAGGMTTDPDGTVHVELPGPWGSPAREY